MIDSKIMETTKSILKEFGNTYFSDKGTLKRNKVIEDLDAYTPILMKALLANQLIHDTYTESVVIDDKSVEIFKLNQFIEMFTYKEYWQDSYTKFENKIGLTAGGKFIDETADVVLDFPFKDTVLKAGMTKEDQKDADEPFLHETIAKAEIDQLLEPKIFVNATKYDQENLDGAPVDNFEDNNLIIKGNNLIALHSLKQRYLGKVKMIYLDPPYYFDETKPADAFKYNSNFKLSTWLIFMKNRLEIANELLTDGGVIFISMGEDGQAHLKLLMDNIFGRSNFVQTFIWRNTDNADSLGKKSRSSVEYVHAYEKNKDSSVRWIGKKTENGDAPLLNTGNPVGTLTFKPGIIRFKISDGIYPAGKYESLEALTDIIVEDGKNSNEIKLRGTFKWGQKNLNNEVAKGGDFIIKSDKFSIRYQKAEGSTMAPEKFVDGPYLSKIFGVGSNEDAKSHIGTLGLDFSFSKPESLIAYFIRAVTQENDIVMDFFMGSGTTQAAALKMNRRFIGVEQLDYISDGVERLNKALEGEQGGISKDVNWQGGGSFVYAELMEKNQGYLKDVQQAETTKQLEDVVHRMIEGGADFDFRVDVEKVLQDPEYQTMSLADKKQLMVKVIDKNQLYYAYSDMEDRDVQELMSESDITFNKSFYGERDL
ncbi:site-specific DNA-methyltransferase [Pediococcus inopinatus]|uniref:site-specific DNA-methyltransferase n=1 Tax=Pediococcus inopinatus TaxID=114090 RepID=UPI000708FB64|nr:site-specific DNA-methyltransferase [Pediococcus inopinatus]AVL01258.1 type III restriction endonuclease subunit M [Pediococcus inopinatus]KRN60524.1 type III restriction-modification system methylation subunit [Pediococcus inopinatus]